MKKRILFVIRGKLGDSLIAFMALQKYAEAFPEHDITLLTRKAYAPLFAEDFRGKLMSFDHRLEMIIKLLWLRLNSPRFDVLAVLWGFGSPIRWIGKLVSATRKINLNHKISGFAEWPSEAPIDSLVDNAWRVIRMFAPSVAKATLMSLPALANTYRVQAPEEILGIVPLADEARKCMDAKTLSPLLSALVIQRPNQRFWVLLNRRDLGAEALFDLPLPPRCEVKTFSGIQELVALLGKLSEWMGVDTGLYHLAAGMNIPATLFFGPTQPKKIVFAEQKAISYRLQAMGDAHCEVKTCMQPQCLHQAVALFARFEYQVQLNTLPKGCLLPHVDAAMLARLQELGSYR